MQLSVRSVAVAAVCGLSIANLPAQLDLHEETNRKLGLIRSDIVQVVVQGQVGKQHRVAVNLGGQWTLMDLAPRSVRAPGFRLRGLDSGGRWRDFDPGPVVTMRGQLVGDRASRVAASIMPDGIYARVVLGGGRDYWLQPVPNGKTPLGQLYILYRDSDVKPITHPCGADLLARNRLRPLVAGGATSSFGASNIAELGCEADFEFFTAYGSVANAGNRIQSVVNTMNLQYESQVDVQHQITSILVRTSAAQPYTSTDAVTLLNQFRNEWQANQGNIQRDVAQLFTGKQINGGTIGIAWIGAVCTSFGYGVVQSDFNGNFSCATDLSAHELGHNWNAQHCSCTSHTMNPFITCANNFSAGSISTIVSFRNSRTCLSSPQTNQPPSVSAGGDQTVQLSGGATLTGSVVDDGLPNPPGVVTSAWTQVSGPGLVSFGSPSSASTTVSFPAAGVYVLRLTGNDSALQTSDDVTITVQSGGGTEKQLAFDNFDSGSGSGGSGWSGGWLGSGDVRLTTSASPHSRRWHLRIRRTGMARRSVDLSGASSVKLIFWAKLRSFESSDRALVRVSTNGGATYTTVRTFVNGDDDNTYRRYEIPLSSVSNQTVIQFLGQMSASRDYFYVDDVEIRGVR